MFFLIFLPLVLFLDVSLLVSKIDPRVHRGSLGQAGPVAGIQISRQSSVRIKPIFTNSRLLHLTLEPPSEEGDSGKHGRNVALKWKVINLYLAMILKDVSGTGNCELNI